MYLQNKVLFQHVPQSGIVHLTPEADTELKVEADAETEAETEVKVEAVTG